MRFEKWGRGEPDNVLYRSYAKEIGGSALAGMWTPILILRPRPLPRAPGHYSGVLEPVEHYHTKRRIKLQAGRSRLGGRRARGLLWQCL